MLWNFLKSFMFFKIFPTLLKGGIKREGLIGFLGALFGAFLGKFPKNMFSKSRF